MERVDIARMLRQIKSMTLRTCRCVVSMLYLSHGEPTCSFGILDPYFLLKFDNVFEFDG